MMSTAHSSLTRLSLAAPALLLLLALALPSPTRAHADEVNINYYLASPDYPDTADPRYFGSAVPAPWGYQIEITPPPAAIISEPAYPDEGVWERRQARTFHPGYSDWSAYYDSPPWHHRDDMDFHPYWVR